MGIMRPVGEASGSGAPVAQPAQGGEENPQEMKTQEKAQKAFAYLAYQPKDCEDTWKHYRERLGSGDVTYRDAQKLQEIQEVNLKVIGTLHKLNEKNPTGQAHTIYPLSFHKYGRFCLDDSYYRSVYDCMMKMRKIATLNRWGSEYNNKRENLAAWSDCIRFYYQTSHYAGIYDQTTRKVEEAIKGLRILEVRYAAENPSGPKSQIVSKTIEALDDILAILDEKMDALSDFPSGIKMLLSLMNDEIGLKDVCYFSYQFQFLLDGFVEKEEYRFLNHLGYLLGAGGSNNHLALALACWFLADRKNFSLDPEGALKKLREEVESKQYSPEFWDIFHRVKKAKDAFLTQMNNVVNASDLAMQEKEEKEEQYIAQTALNALSGLIVAPKTILDYVIGLFKSYNETKNVISETESKPSKKPTEG